MKYIFYTTYAYLHHLMDSLVRLCIIIILLFIFCHKIGFVTRCIHKFVENELKKITNGTNVTIGKIQIDIIKGHATIYDLVIHSPKREEWLWDSPLFVRVGKISAYFNILTIIDPISIYLKLWPFRDIYGGVVEDIQVFIEKRRNIFNFHLLDPSLDIPVPKDVLKFYEREMKEEEAKLEEVITLEQNIEALDEPLASASSACSNDNDNIECNMNTQSTDEEITTSSTPTASDKVLKENIDAEKKANEIVTSMLGAVSSLGRAANEGGKEGFSQAIRSRSKLLVKNLKQMQSSKNINAKESSQSSDISGRSNSIASVQSIAKESLQVIKNMQKAVERNVEEIKEQVDAFTKPPPKKLNWKKPRMDTIRIGYLLGKDIRIFTKGIILNSSQKINNAKASTSANTISSNKNWSKPIYLKELSFSASELAPPSNSLNAQDNNNDQLNYELLGMTPDRIVDTVLKKGYAEMAKTNAGRVLETAFSEVFAWMDKK